MPETTRKRPSKIKSTRHWHRYLGVIAAVFGIVLSVTGLMLNHTEELNLDSRFVKSKFLLDLYGIKPPTSPVSFSAGNHWVSQIEKHLYLDGEFVDESESQIVGAVRVSEFLVIGSPESLLILTDSGDLVERIGREAGIPGGIRRIGVDNNRLLNVDSQDGIFKADQQILTWNNTDNTAISWSTGGTLPTEIDEKLKAAYLGKGLPLERVVLDIHSGRIIWGWGIYFFDLIAVIIVVLSVTGIYLFYFPSGIRRKKPDPGSAKN